MAQRLKRLPANVGLIPGSGRFPGEGNGNPLWYSCLENPMDGGAWWATVHGVAKSQTRLSDFTYFLTKFRTNYNSLKLINHLISLSGSFKQSVFIVNANASIKVQLCGLFQNSQRVWI